MTKRHRACGPARCGRARTRCPCSGCGPTRCACPTATASGSRSAGGGSRWWWPTASRSPAGSTCSRCPGWRPWGSGCWPSTWPATAPPPASGAQGWGLTAYRRFLGRVLDELGVGAGRPLRPFARRAPPGRAGRLRTGAGHGPAPGRRRRRRGVGRPRRLRLLEPGPARRRRGVAGRRHPPDDVHDRRPGPQAAGPGHPPGGGQRLRPLAAGGAGPVGAAVGPQRHDAGPAEGGAGPGLRPPRRAGPGRAGGRPPATPPSGPAASWCWSTARPTPGCWRTRRRCGRSWPSCWGTGSARPACRPSPTPVSIRPRSA